VRIGVRITVRGTKYAQHGAGRWWKYQGGGEGAAIQ
jgi:hypothetical protein